MKSYIVRNLGENKGAPRLWLEGRVAETAGFLPKARFEILVEIDSPRITLKLIETGTRVVSQKVKNDKAIPIIDLNSREVLGAFEGMDKIRVCASAGQIEITPLATAVRVKERLDRIKEKVLSGKPLSVGSLSHGGGVLSLAIHDGLQSAGLPAELAFANDIREDLLEHASSKNPAWCEGTQLLAAPMQELAFDEDAMNKLAKIDIMEAGIPCNGASISGRSKGGLDCAEAHEDVGHLLVAFLAIVAKVNPAVCVVENVPPYQNSASMWIMRHQLRDLGYTVHEEVLNGADWNLLEHRKRMCMVAVTNGMEFTMADVYRPEPVAVRLGDVLEDVALDDPRWSQMQYLKDKEVRDKAAGKGFSMQIVGPESNKVGTIGKSYQKNRSTEPKVQHPTKPELLRLLSPLEHARVKGVLPVLIEGLPSTTAHELLGQGIVPPPFMSIGQAIGKSVMAYGSGNKGAVDAPVQRPNAASNPVEAETLMPAYVDYSLGNKLADKPEESTVTRRRAFETIDMESLWSVA